MRRICDENLLDDVANTAGHPALEQNYGPVILGRAIGHEAAGPGRQDRTWLAGYTDIILAAGHKSTSLVILLESAREAARDGA